MAPLARLAAARVAATFLLAVSAAPAGVGPAVAQPAVAQPAAATLPVVAAENFYGDIARQIGGSTVTVTSVLSNPDQDPHLFEANPSVARSISAARIVIANGIDYDPWMTKLLAAARSNQRTTLTVADLVGRKLGDNPHIWYDPGTMRALARALAGQLAIIDPPHAADTQQRLAAFEASLVPIDAHIAALRTRLAGTAATATEPVFGYMFDALGMTVRNEQFQLAVMNNTEPGAADIAAFERDLKTHQVHLLVFNSQASDPIAARMARLAKSSHIPVIGVTETEPAGRTYQAWMSTTLDAVDHALPK